MHRVTLPDGGWADIREVDEITVAGKRGITKITTTLAPILPAIAAAQARAEEAGAEVDLSELPALGMTEDQVDAMMRLAQATVVACLAAWSRPEPLPTLITIEDMPASLYESLQAATAQQGAQVASLELDMSPGKDETPDPKGRSGD